MPFNVVAHIETTPGAGTVPIATVGGTSLYARLDANDAIKTTTITPFLLWLYHTAHATGGGAILRQPGKVD